MDSSALSARGLGGSRAPYVVYHHLNQRHMSNGVCGCVCMCASAQMCLLECLQAAWVLDVSPWLRYFKAEMEMLNRWHFNDWLMACLPFLLQPWKKELSSRFVFLSAVVGVNANCLRVNSARAPGFNLHADIFDVLSREQRKELLSQPQSSLLMAKVTAPA